MKRLNIQVCLFNTQNCIILPLLLHLVSIDPANCTNGDIQLIGGNNSAEGVIEICMNGTWGSVCNDGWGAQETAVVCKQLRLQIAGE